MSFADTLKRLREVANLPVQRNSDVRVRQQDLRDLLYHFERLDNNLRAKEPARPVLVTVNPREGVQVNPTDVMILEMGSLWGMRYLSLTVRGGEKLRVYHSPYNGVDVDYLAAQFKAAMV